MMRKRIGSGIVVVFGLGLLLAALALGGPRSAIDWRDQQAVAFQSDDWGLAGFVPTADFWQGLDREALDPGRFPPVYWQSTLEDADVVNRMVDLFAATGGRDGVPAVFQPNYVMASLAWDDSAGNWVTRYLPELPPQYVRPGLWQAVAAGRQQGVWHPEFHATLHYDPAVRRAQALASEPARTATLRGSSLFPGSESARELAPWRPASEMSAELDGSLRAFGALFGRPVGSVIAPDYTWHASIEDLWQSRGLRLIQAKREQRNSEWPGGIAGRLYKYADRQWSRLIHPGRVYLERNCRLEPVQAPDPQAVVARCLADTRAAWARGEPAIVETHRVNFAHTDPAVVAVGVDALAAYLADIATSGPVFLCDTEIAGLMRRGTSWRVAGSSLILRNASRSTRVVAVPAEAMSRLGTDRPGGAVFRLVPGTVRILAGDDLR